MTQYAYDIECFKNLFTATFVNVEDDEERHVFSIGLGKDDLQSLYKFLWHEMVLIGYNNHSYDDPILRFMMTYQKGENLLSELYSLSGKLTDDNYRNDKKIMELRYPRKKVYPWDSIDLMKILAFDKVGISLKQTAINLRWYKVQDMPVEYNTTLKDNQLDDILAYNLNDVLITKRLYEEIAPIRELRSRLSDMYGINLSSASDSKIANMILENIYANELRMDISAIRDMRTYRESVLLGDCIAKFVEFETQELKNLYDELSSTVVYDYNKYQYSQTVSFANCTFNLGVGGLHTDDMPGKFITDSEYLIQDLDVASYYPNLILNNKFFPEHLGKNFGRVLSRITAERLEAKRSGDKVKADGLKITINSIFGKLGSDNFWLLDAKQFLSTTISGQLGLLMLVEDLYLAGIQILSCNTDGIVCRIPRGLMDKYYEVTRAWEQQTNLQLEFTPYKKYIRRDVNAYITEKEDGTTKQKGAFLTEVDLKKAYRMPIVAKALHNYFINNIPVKDTIENCRDIMEFCISQKTGANFQVELHQGKKITHLQKTNRFFISKKGGNLLKRDKTSRKMIGLYVGNLVCILNEYDPAVPFENYNVDFSFYVKEVMKIVDEIEPKQLPLFDLSSIPRSTLTKMEVEEKEEDEIKENVLTLRELNALGKNQILKKIESMVAKREKIDNISPRYVYVAEFDARNMLAVLYCLTKGVAQEIRIDHKAYNKEKIEKGKLMFCRKFSKSGGAFTLTDYSLIDKIQTDEKGWFYS